MLASSRRDFLKHSAAATLVASASGAAFGMTQPEGAKEPKPAKIDVEKRQFGKTDMKVAILGFGSAEIGYERTDQQVVDRILNAALDQGLNVVDTAECYVD